MVALTGGCTAMKLSSEDPTTRMEAVRKFTEPDDLAAIVCMTYPDDVRLEAFNELVANKDQAHIDAVAKALYCGHYESIRATDFLLRSQYDQSPDSRASFDGTEKELRTAIARNISKEALSYVLEAGNDEVLKELVKESPHVLAALKLRAEKGDNSVVTRVATLLSGETFKVASKDSAIVQALPAELLLAWYEETKDEALFTRLLNCQSQNYDAFYDKLLKLNPDKFLEVCVAARIAGSKCKVSKEKQKEWLKILAQKYPESELALDCLLANTRFVHFFDEEDRSRVLTEANASRIFERLQKRLQKRKREVGLSNEYIDSVTESLATIDFLNACPEFANKVDPKAAVSLLEDELMFRKDVASFSKLSPRIAQALIEVNPDWATISWDGWERELYDTLLKRLPLATAHAILKKQADSGSLNSQNIFDKMQMLVRACELNDATVETLLEIDLAPSATGYIRLRDALKVDAVSEASKAKIRAYMEKVRAEALANEAKVKEERLVIDHCYVPMREIDHYVLGPAKGVGYWETNGTITRFGWTGQQCYDWFGLENDEFRWKFAQKFGLSDFKPTWEKDDIVNISTTRARGKQVEFVYNDDGKYMLIMRGVQ